MCKTYWPAIKAIPVLMAILVSVSCWKCKRPVRQGNDAISVSGLRYIGEYVFPEKKYLKGSLIGGFSGIDFTGKNWLLICDDAKPPIRYYSAAIRYDADKFYGVEIDSVTEITDENGEAFQSHQVDAESIRYDKEANSFIWSSEGNIRKGINPDIQESSMDGKFIRRYNIPSLFFADTLSETRGPRHNGAFEGLSLSKDKAGFWASLELPLKQDGEAPVYEHVADSPVRFLYFDKEAGNFTKQFAYKLDKAARKGDFEINGVSEILEYDARQFLVAERSYAQGNYADGGNNILIYKADAARATDVSKYDSLKGVSYVPMSKTLLFDFETIRNQLSKVTNGLPKVDNIEGISFGPKLSNGRLSLVVVADNNFSALGEQLSQFIVFEVIP